MCTLLCYYAKVTTYTDLNDQFKKQNFMNLVNMTSMHLDYRNVCMLYGTKCLFKYLCLLLL